jgi:hypothetical protein
MVEAAGDPPASLDFFEVQGRYDSYKANVFSWLNWLRYIIGT